MHVCFAEDLLMFCKVNLYSIQLMQDAFHKFFVISILQANVEKSFIFLTRVKSVVKQTILNTLGYTEGEITFKFLRVLIFS